MTDTLSPDRDAKIAEDKARDEAIEWALRPAASVVRYGPTRKFSTDPVAFDSLMQEIGRRGLGTRYVYELLRRVLDGVPLQYTHGLVWDMMSAPQSQRAAAALAVLTEGTT